MAKKIVRVIEEFKKSKFLKASGTRRKLVNPHSKTNLAEIREADADQERGTLEVNQQRPHETDAFMGSETFHRESQEEVKDSQR